MTLTHAEKVAQNNVLHVAFVLDASSSMGWYGHDKRVPSIIDAQVKNLKKRSEEKGLETRVSVYTFSNQAKCVFYDKDVYRLPTLGSHYRANGGTALIDATWLVIDDLKETPQKYGAHNFLVLAISDGQEQHSRYHSASELNAKLLGLEDNFTVTCLVPDDSGENDARSFGFAPGNIKQWNATSDAGFEKAMADVDQAVDNFMTQTATNVGFRGTKTMFSGGVSQVNHQTVRTQLSELKTPHQMIHVSADEHRTRTKDFVEANGLQYVSGTLFYQLTKPEKIQAYKQIIIRDKNTNVLYSGPQARSILNLPSEEKRVKPDVNPLYQVFVQSSNGTRLLMEHTDVVILNPTPKR